MNDNVIITGTTALFSLTAYLVAKKSEHIDRIPAMIIGGFIGSAIGNEIVKSDLVKKNRRKICKR